MITKDLEFTQEQLEMFAEENNDIYFECLARVENPYSWDDVIDTEESFYW